MLTWGYIHAQTPAPYDLQRQKVNQLLEIRSKNFGQYEQSLTARTGIFGLQTKKDIKRSNEILRDIVLNDNQIFRELKVLLDYKNVTSEQLAQNFNEKSNQIERYKLAIKKLQDQNERLQYDLKEQKAKSSFLTFVSILLLVSLAAIIVLLFKTKR